MPRIVFASGLGGITDLTVGPDSYLYIVSISEGKIFRILPDLSGTNNTETKNREMLSAVPSEERQNIPTVNLSKTKDIGNKNNDLLVSIKALKNSVVRGDSQNVTIIVTDSASRPIANAAISGNLIYPGGNFEKKFKGITDLDGKFVYSWLIGENGDFGSLSVDVDISSPGYPLSSVTGSFDIVESSEE